MKQFDITIGSISLGNQDGDSNVEVLKCLNI